MKSEAKCITGHLKIKDMEQMLTPIISNNNAVIGAKKDSCYVDQSLLQFIKDIDPDNKLRSKTLDRILRELFKPVRSRFINQNTPANL